MSDFLRWVEAETGSSEVEGDTGRLLLHWDDVAFVYQTDGLKKTFSPKWNVVHGMDIGNRDDKLGLRMIVAPGSYWYYNNHETVALGRICAIDVFKNLWREEEKICALVGSAVTAPKRIQGDKCDYLSSPILLVIRIRYSAPSLLLFVLLSAVSAFLDDIFVVRASPLDNLRPRFKPHPTLVRML
ncbi:hypothetical protein Tco_0099018 [Tanacetum coccineum]